MKIFLILLSINVLADEMTVISRFKKFDLNYSEKNISFTSHDLKLHLESKPCNKSLIETFKKEMELMKRGSALKVGERTEELNFIMNGKKYHEPYGSIRSKILLNIPEEMKRMKKVEMRLCK